MKLSSDMKLPTDMKPSVELFTAANGQTSARVQDGRGRTIALFSAYNPGEEAERFVFTALKDKQPACLVILGAGLGHLEAAAEKLLPRARIIPVPYAPGLVVSPGGETSAPGGAATGAAFDLDQPGALAARLEQAVGEREADEVEVIEWPASARAFPDTAGRARLTLLRILKENAWSALTVGASGRRWLVNSLVNFLSLEPSIDSLPPERGRVTVIAAAGPSLSRALPLLAAHRERIEIWALTSSLAALGSRGLECDLAVATDAGYYASLLLHSGIKPVPLLAMPLSAARGAWRASRGLMLFAQPNFFEQELLGRCGWKTPVVPAHGTVAGTALLLALAARRKAVVCCGLDFCYDDVMSHALPHPHHAMLERAAMRLAPLSSLAFRRALDFAPERLPGTRCRTGKALALYAASFESIAAARGVDVYRLFPSPVDVPGLGGIDGAGFEELLKQNRGGEDEVGSGGAVSWPDRGARIGIVRGLLDEWLARLGRVENGRGPAAAPAIDRVHELMRFFSGRTGRALRGAPETARRETAAWLAGLREKFAGEGVHA